MPTLFQHALYQLIQVQTPLTKKCMHLLVYLHDDSTIPSDITHKFVEWVINKMSWYHHTTREYILFQMLVHELPMMSPNIRRTVQFMNHKLSCCV